MESFRLSEPAERDLLDLHDYVALKNGTSRARALKAEILSAACLLARMPGMGHQREDLPPSLRAWAVHRWLILFRPETVPLEIVRIVGGWQDVEAFRLEDPEP